jgi:nitrite reductase/ring-hydroxylating ferredoxin subunit
MENLSHSNFTDGYFEVCELSDLKEKSGKRFIIDDVEIAVFKVNDEVYALDNICAHQHSPLIYDGFIEDGCVVCPAHGWKFNLSDGRTPEGGKGLTIHHVKLINGKIFVKVIKKTFNW